MLFPTHKIADNCRSFIQRRSAVLGSPVTARLVNLVICPQDDQNDAKSPIDKTTFGESGCAQLYIVLFPRDSFAVAKEFWQHTGLGISSRLAEKCLSLLPDTTTTQRPCSPITNRMSGKGHNRHYSAVKPSIPSQASTTSAEDTNPDAVYLEERYGRNLPLEAASFAKRALRSRVAGVMIRDGSTGSPSTPCAAKDDFAVGPSTRGITDVAAHDVYLQPSGMSAIWMAHDLALAIRPPAKSVCFGYVKSSTPFVLLYSFILLQIPIYRYPQDPPEMGTWMPLPWFRNGQRRR